MVVGATIHERCLRILGEQIGLTDGHSALELSLDADLEQTLVLDSMDAFDLILAAEDEFAIEIPDEAFDDVRTLRQFESMVEVLVKDAEV